RVLQLSRDPGFAEEASLVGGTASPLGPKFLEGDIAAEVGVMGQPDLADAAGGVQAGGGGALVRPGGEGHGRRHRGGVGRRGGGEGVWEAGVRGGGGRAPTVVGGAREAGSRAPAVLLKFASQ